MSDPILTFDGDILKSVVFKKGDERRPLWRKIEQLAPNEMILWADRFDSLCAIPCEWALAQALEDSYGLEISKRNQYVRTILCEINRLVWLTTYLGKVVRSLGQRTLFQQAFVLCEQVFTIQEELTGGRILPQAFSLGGCRRELPMGNIQKIKSFLKDWTKLWTAWVELVIGDELLNARLKGLMVVDKALVEKLGWWGIVGKGSGIDYDSRKHRPHGAYHFVDFKIRSEQGGDAKSRFEIGIHEVNLSLELVSRLSQDISGDGSPQLETSHLRPGFFSGAAESAKGPIISCVEIDDKGVVATVRLFSSGQRVWPVVDHLFNDLRAEDFAVALASLGLDAEDSEI
jgi:NADH-quinone oxidoreductase subunit D